MPNPTERVEVSEAMEHELKCWPPFFDVVEMGVKTFEYRQDDRGYKAGDVLRLREFNPFAEPPAYTGREVKRRVTYVLGADSLATIPGGFVIMGLEAERDQAQAAGASRRPQCDARSLAV